MSAAVPARRSRRWVGLLVVPVLGAATLAGCGSSAPVPAATAVAEQGYRSADGTVRTWPPAGRGAPVELSGTDVAGQVQDVTAWRGDVVVLNTWYAACPPCRAEAGDLAALATDRAADGVHLLGINGTDDAGAAGAFQRTFAVPYPSILDTDGSAVAALSGAVPVQAVPTTVVLDPQGRVAARVLGRADRSVLSGMIDDVLTEDGGPSAEGTAAP